MSLFSRTVTTTFLLTPLGINFEEYKFKGFIDAYVGDFNKEDYGDYFIFMLFKLEDLDIKELIKNPNYVEDYDYNGFVVVVFLYPEKFRMDYDLIKEGKYSKVSSEFKKSFPKEIYFYDSETKRKFLGNSYIYKVINRFAYIADDLAEMLWVEVTPEMEYWKGFELERETLDINKIYEKYNEGVSG